jgi:hypothetical protein
MIGLLILVQSAVVQNTAPPTLDELSRIVAPYAECEFRHEPEVKAISQRWLDAAQRSRSEPTNTAAAAEAKALMEQATTLRLEVRRTCGYDEMHTQLKARLLQLHPNMDESRAFWLARSVFSELNSLNSQLLRLKSGILPSPPAPPPAPPPIKIGTEPNKIGAN